MLGGLNDEEQCGWNQGEANLCMCPPIPYCDLRYASPTHRTDPQQSVNWADIAAEESTAETKAQKSRF